MSRILIIEKNQVWRGVLSAALESAHDIAFFSHPGEAAETLKQRLFNAIVVDLQNGEDNSLDFVQWATSTMPDVPVIATSESEKADIVVRIIKSGAYDFIAKPFSKEKISYAVEKSLEDRSLKNEIDYLRREQDTIYKFDDIIAYSPAMVAVLETLKKFALTDSTILMRGETGTGKSFLSGTIHFNSNRKKRPYVKINCANIPETLLESELFGHEKGAFTGADKRRVGRFEQANGGTLFLDEIGEMSLNLQAKLLRVLEDKSFERVGGNQTIFSDARVIAATNRNLEEHIREGKFREDLFYRINILSVTLPPLRERSECIEPLSNAILEKVSRSLRKKIDGFAPPVMETMRRYNWPGNIRQLANAIERAVILEESNFIGRDSMLLQDAGAVAKVAESKNDVGDLKAGEKEMILSALEKSLWIQKDAAKLLGISPRAMNYKIKKFGISHPRWRKHRE